MLQHDTKHAAQAILANYKGYEKEPLQKVCALIVKLSTEIEQLQQRLAFLEAKVPQNV